MPQKIVAGNWKMNKTCDDGISLYDEIEALLIKQSVNDVKVIIAPPFILIREFATASKKVAIAAQNCSDESFGAFTGEVSAGMIKSAGASYVIVGHSERRIYYGESNLVFCKKMDRCLENNLTPIYCIGETLSERNSNNQFDVIKKQLVEGIFHLSKDAFSKTILAYEPVWAIGTGVTATPGQAQEIHLFIRNVIREKYGDIVANSYSIIYGGSCNAQNAKELFACADIDGGFCLDRVRRNQHERFARQYEFEPYHAWFWRRFVSNKFAGPVRLASAFAATLAVLFR